MLDLNPLYNKILYRINSLTFRGKGFGEGDILAQAMIKRDKEEIDHLLELKEEVSNIRKRMKDMPQSDFEF